MKKKGAKNLSFTQRLQIETLSNARKQLLNERLEEQVLKKDQKKYRNVQLLGIGKWIVFAVVIKHLY
ncbi:MAG: hypothetical protein SPH07_08050 [Eubacteriales bacterium]|nr:hypothetical protein [Eubacteriales bacterium]MDY5440326.1 hypothetical protein [Eubacteriales bacterium]